MSKALPTDQGIVELIASAITSAIESVGELDDPREAAEWEVQKVLERLTFEVDPGLDPEDQLSELRYEIQCALDYIHSAVQGMHQVHAELIYTSDIEEYYEENTDACDQYYGECKDMANNLDSLKSYMVQYALDDQASIDVYELAGAIEDIDPEDII